MWTFMDCCFAPVVLNIPLTEYPLTKPNSNYNNHSHSHLVTRHSLSRNQHNPSAQEDLKVLKCPVVTDRERETEGEREQREVEPQK